MVTSCCKRVSDGVSMRSMITTMSTDLHIEFCKSKASADRWHEEVELLREEMARTKQFFKFRSSEWSALASSQPHGTPGDKAKVKDDMLMLSSRLHSSIACMTAMFLSGRAFEYTHTMYLLISTTGGFIIAHTWKFHTFSSYMLCSLTHGQPVICVDMLALLAVA
jgi:hypothetical protein